MLPRSGDPGLTDTIAFDRASSRSFDQDGHLHVVSTNISKATVNPYRGAEIPNYQELGLDADRVYNLFRDPDEMANAVETFNGKPLLFDHKPVHAEDHDHAMTVGSVTNARYVAPYLKADLSVWSGPAIRAIEDGSQKELSSAYRYRADMTPGTFQGARYDGVMRDIACNHVALVAKGRAGSDVVVGDQALVEHMHLATLTLAQDATAHDPGNGKFTSGGGSSSSSHEDKSKIGVGALKEKLEGMSHEKLTAALKNKDVDPKIKKHIEKELDSRADRGTMKGHREMAHDSFRSITMAKTALSQAGAQTQGALAVYFRPKLAMDAKLDFGPIVKGLTAKNYKARVPSMVADLKKATAGKLAQDASIDDVAEVIEALAEILPEEVPEVVEELGGTEEDGAIDEDGGDLRSKLAAAGLTEDEIAKVMAALGTDTPPAMDESEEDKAKRLEKLAQDTTAMKDMVTKTAMDAAIRTAVKSASDAITANFKAIDEARREVRPSVGEIAIACDSAAAVYRAALSIKSIDHAAVPDAGLRPLYQAIAAIPAQNAKPTSVAMDAAAAKSFADRYGTARIGHAA